MWEAEFGKLQNTQISMPNRKSLAKHFYPNLKFKSQITSSNLNFLAQVSDKISSQFSNHNFNKIEKFQTF